MQAICIPFFLRDHACSGPLPRIPATCLVKQLAHPQRVAPYPLRGHRVVLELKPLGEHGRVNHAGHKPLAFCETPLDALGQGRQGHAAGLGRPKVNLPRQLRLHIPRRGQEVAQQSVHRVRVLVTLTAAAAATGCCPPFFRSPCEAPLVADRPSVPGSSLCLPLASRWTRHGAWQCDRMDHHSGWEPPEYRHPSTGSHNN